MKKTIYSLQDAVDLYRPNYIKNNRHLVYNEQDLYVYFPANHLLSEEFAKFLLGRNAKVVDGDLTITAIKGYEIKSKHPKSDTEVTRQIPNKIIITKVFKE